MSSSTNLGAYMRCESHEVFRTEAPQQLHGQANCSVLVTSRLNNPLLDSLRVPGVQQHSWWTSSLQGLCCLLATGTRPLLLRAHHRTIRTRRRLAAAATACRARLSSTPHRSRTRWTSPSTHLQKEQYDAIIKYR